MSINYLCFIRFIKILISHFYTKRSDVLAWREYTTPTQENCQSRRSKKLRTAHLNASQYGKNYQTSSEIPLALRQGPCLKFLHTGTESQNRSSLHAPFWISTHKQHPGNNFFTPLHRRRIPCIIRMREKSKKVFFVQTPIELL